MNVGRRKIVGSGHLPVQPFMEFHHQIGKPVSLVYDGKQLILRPPKEKRKEVNENGSN